MSVSFDQKVKLGEGHFGEVWYAIETGLGLECALKLIPTKKVVNQANFFHEAQILKIAEHSNVIKVFDTGHINPELIYVSMEYHERKSLDDEARGGFIGLDRARKVMIDVLRGLEHAHKKGIIHRDIKPANILIGRRMEGILSDFGLALPAQTALDSTIIKDYQYLLHLAPEVRDYLNHSIESDIYACGITLYRLVNGDMYLPRIRPYNAQLLAADGIFPDKTRYREFVPIQLRKIINKALNAEPDDRYSSAASLRHALEQLTLKIDWDESRLPAGFRWVGVSQQTTYEVSRLTLPDAGLTQVSTKKGRSATKLRAVHELSGTFRRLDQATQFTKKVLQKLTTT